MKRTYYIKSVERYPDAYHTQYVPVATNAAFLTKLIEKHKLIITKINQNYAWKWELKLKGKRKDMVAFEIEFANELAEIYCLEEEGWI